MHDRGENIFELPVVDALEIGAIGSFEDCMVTLVPSLSSFVLSIGVAVNGRSDGSSTGTSSCAGDCNGLGFVEDGLGGGDGGGFDFYDGVGGQAELVHAVPGSPGLFILQRIQRTPAMKVVAFSWLYWPPVVVESVSLTMLARSCSRMVVRSAKQVSAMIELFNT